MLNDKLKLKLGAMALGMVTTFAVQKMLSTSWKLVTGEEPPEPGDPEVPAFQAFTWAIASAVGVGAAQLAVNRFAARKLLERGEAFDVKPVKFKVN